MNINFTKKTFFIKKERIRNFIMRIALLLLLCFTILGFKPIDIISKNVRITIEEDKTVSVNEIFDMVKSQTGYSFVYKSDLFNGYPKVVLKKGVFKAKNLLDMSLSKGKFIYGFSEGNTIVIQEKSKSININQTRTVKGVVTDEEGVPLSGVDVFEKNTPGETTKDDGTYEISLSSSSEDIIIVFSFRGLLTQEVKVGKQAVINVVLKKDLTNLNEVLMTGYHSLSKEESTGSYSTVNAEAIENRVQTNILSRIEGAANGVSLYKGTPVIRGGATFSADNTPLIVVDGVRYEGDLEAINPKEIENITILKDASATSIYGVRSANGVIVITTKGGYVGGPTFSYSSTRQLTPLPDRSYANLMSSSEFIDYQMYIFDKAYDSNIRQNSALAQNQVSKLLYDREDGNITEEYFNSEINRLRGVDGYEQVENELLTNKITYQHNFSMKGGSDKHQYSLALNFTTTGSNEVNNSVDRIGFNTKNSFQLTDRVDLDLSVIGSYNSSDNYTGISGLDLLGGSMVPFQTLKDENGDLSQWEYIKSSEEVNRLNSLGLIDETYYPLKELKTHQVTYENPYININIGGKFDFTKSLNLELRGQTEIGNSHTKDFSSEENYLIRKLINDASQFEDDGDLIFNIPYGGRVIEKTIGQQSYTLKAQLNYNNLFKQKHDVNVFIGAERRQVINTTHGFARYGYDNDRLFFSAVNEATLRSSVILGTNSYDGTFQFTGVDPASTYIDDKYVSFYGNGSYEFDGNLRFNASIRVDQSNLYGTNSKYQYRPLWSIGANYRINTDSISWLDLLKIRSTYGINGNVYRESDLYTIFEVSPSDNINTVEEALRWEKTNSTNVAIDYSLFSNRISGSIDFYNKKTTNLIGNLVNDATENYASMNNKGFEFQLHSKIIDDTDFKWSANYLFSYNKNEIKELNVSETSVDSYFGLQAREGKPFNSIYSINYAGLDETGSPTAYKADGTIVSTLEELEYNDLIHEGTYNPPYHMSLSNEIKYKQFEFSFLLVYYGGNVQRDVAAGFYPSFSNPYDLNNNLDRINLNYWKQPGDEEDIYISPAYKATDDNATDLWKYANIHVQKADYIKLRNIALAYNLPNVILDKMKISGLRFSFDVQNPLRWASNRNNLDPEVWNNQNNRGAVIMPTYTLGVNLNF